MLGKRQSGSLDDIKNLLKNDCHCRLCTLLFLLVSIFNFKWVRVSRDEIWTKYVGNMPIKSGKLCSIKSFGIEFFRYIQSHRNSGPSTWRHPEQGQQWASVAPLKVSLLALIWLRFFNLQLPLVLLEPHIRSFSFLQLWVLDGHCFGYQLRHFKMEWRENRARWNFYDSEWHVCLQCALLPSLQWQSDCIQSHCLIRLANTHTIWTALLPVFTVLFHPNILNGTTLSTSERTDFIDAYLTTTTN